MAQRVKNPIAADTLPPEYLQAIGEIVLLWGLIEFQLRVVIRESVSTSKDIGRALLGGMPMAALCRTLKSLAKSEHWIAEEALRAQLVKLASDIKRASEQRNSYAHPVFVFFDDQPNTFSLLKQDHHDLLVKEISLDELRAIAAASRLILGRARDATSDLKQGKRKRLGRAH